MNINVDENKFPEKLSEFIEKNYHSFFEDFAEKIGISEKDIYGYIYYLKMPKLSNAKKIASIMGYKVEELLGKEELLVANLFEEVGYDFDLDKLREKSKIVYNPNLRISDKEKWQYFREHILISMAMNEEEENLITVESLENFSIRCFVD